MRIYLWMSALTKQSEANPHYSRQLTKPTRFSRWKWVIRRSSSRFIGVCCQTIASESYSDYGSRIGPVLLKRVSGLMNLLIVANFKEDCDGCGETCSRSDPMS